MSFAYAGAKRETCLFPGDAPGGIFFQRPIPGPGGVFHPRRASGPGAAFHQRPASQEAAYAPNTSPSTPSPSGGAPDEDAARAVSLPFPRKTPQADPLPFHESTPKAGPGSAGAVFAFAKTVTVDDLPENGAAPAQPVPESAPKARTGSAGAVFVHAKTVTADDTRGNGAAQGLSSRLGIPGILSPTPAPEGANPCLSDADAKPWSVPVRVMSQKELLRTIEHLSPEKQIELMCEQHEAHTDWIWDLFYRGIRRSRKLYTEYRAIDPNHHRLKALQRSCFACRMHAGHRSGVDGERSVTIGFADGELSWMGTYKCGSGRFCVLCGAQISSRNQKDIRKGLENAINKGYSALLLTYTIPHRVAQSAMELVENLSTAYMLAGKGGDVSRFRKKNGMIGSIVRQEETYGLHGWHPHLHVIQFFDHVLSDEEIAAVTEKLKQKWLAACYKIDIIPQNRSRAFEKRGFDAKPIMNTKDVSEYLSKVGWKNSSAEFKAKAKESIRDNSGKRMLGAAFELSSRDAKAPRLAEGRTPWDIHEGFAGGDPRDTELWLDYVEAFAGKPVVRWSSGLKALLRIDDEDEEDQVKAGEETSLRHIYRVSALHYEQGVARNALWRPILKAIDADDFNTLQAIADQYVIDFIQGKEGNTRYPEILSQTSIRENEADRQRLRRKEADKRRREKAARIKARQEAEERAHVAAEEAYASSLLTGDEIARMKAGRRVYQQKQKDERRKRRDLLRQAKARGKGSVPARICWCA